MVKHLLDIFEGWRDCGLVFFALLDCITSLVSFQNDGGLMNSVMCSSQHLLFLYLVPSLLAVHYFFDGFRWQLYPLYPYLVLMSMEARLFSKLPSLSSLHSTLRESKFYLHPPDSFLVKLINSLIRLFRFEERLTSRVFQLAFYQRFSWLLCFSKRIKWLKVFCVIPSLVFCFIFPVPRLPKPLGGWGCGMEEMQLIADSNDSQCYVLGSSPVSVGSCVNEKRHRKNVQTLNILAPKNLKKFHCLVFYPTEQHRYRGGSCYPWLPSGLESIKIFARLLGLPVFFFRSLLKLETHSIMLAPLSKRRKKFPIVFLSHAVGFTKTTQSMLCEALASNGSIVVSVEHSDGTALPTVPETSVLDQCFSSSCFNDYLRSIPVTHGPVLPEFNNESVHCSTSPFQQYSKEAILHRLCPTPHHLSHVLDPCRHSVPNEARRQVSDDILALSDLLTSMERCNMDTPSPRTDLSRTCAVHRAPCCEASELSSELQLRHTQLFVRVAELRAAHRSIKRLSETSGSWIKDRIDWNASSIVGFGFGGASALMMCICDCIEEAKRRRRSVAQRFQPYFTTFPFPRFQNCILLCPWLDAMMNSELRFPDLPESDVKLKDLGHSCLRLPQNILLVNTTEQSNEKFNNKIRLLKLMKEATGHKVLIQFTRCRKFDFTDLPVLSPIIFRHLGLSGPRAPSKTAQMLNRTIVNFLNLHYRRPLTCLDSKKTPSFCRESWVDICHMRHQGQQDHGNLLGVSLASCSLSPLFKPFLLTRQMLFAQGHWIFWGNKRDDSLSPQESPKRLGSKCLDSSHSSPVADSLSGHEPHSPTASSLSRMLHALKLAGVPDHYIRNLSGIRLSSNLKHRNTQQTLHPNQSLSYPNPLFSYLMEGVEDFMDTVDLHRYQERAQKSFLYNFPFADMCCL